MNFYVSLFISVLVSSLVSGQSSGLGCEGYNGVGDASDTYPGQFFLTATFEDTGVSTQLDLVNHTYLGVCLHTLSLQVFTVS